MNVIAWCATAALGLVSLLLALRPIRDASQSHVVRAVALATGFGILLRAAFAAVQPGAVYDINSYAQIGALVRHGIDVYSPAGAPHYNYPPVELWWSAFASAVAPGGPTTAFAFLVKIPFWLCDAALIPLLAWASPVRLRTRTAWLYAVNPIAIIVASLHGQFEAAVIVPLLVAALLLRRGRRDLSAAAFGCACAVKTWPLFVLPAVLAFIRRRGWARYVVIAAVPGILATAAYWLVQPGFDLRAALGQVFGYLPATASYFGFTLDTSSRPVLAALNVAVLVLVVAVGVTGDRLHRPLLLRLGLGLFLLVALSPTAGNQYYQWPLPFLFAAGYLRAGALYTALVGPAVAYVALFVNTGPQAVSPAGSVLFAVATLALLGGAGLIALVAHERASDRVAATASGAKRRIGTRVGRWLVHDAPLGA